MRLINAFRRLGRDRGGASTVEYALLIGLVAFISVTAWDGIGVSLRRIFEYINTYLI
jgi:Flp pilus assembly pilin Flp